MRNYTEININGYDLEVFNVPFVCSSYIFDWRTFAVETQKLVNAVLGENLTKKQLWNIKLSLDKNTNTNIAIHLMRPVLRALTFTDKEIKYFNGIMSHDITIVYQKQNKRKSYKEMTDDEVLRLFHEYKDKDKIVVCWRMREIMLYTHSKSLLIYRDDEVVASRILEELVPNNVYCTTFDPHLIIKRCLEDDVEMKKTVKRLLQFLEEFVNED